MDVRDKERKSRFTAGAERTRKMIKLNIEYMDSYDDNGVPQEIGCSTIDVTDVLDAMSLENIIGASAVGDATAVLESQDGEENVAAKRSQVTDVYADAIDEYEYGISPKLASILRFLDMLPISIVHMYFEDTVALSEYLADRTFAGALEPSTEKVVVLRRRVDRQFADLVKNLANEYNAVSGMLG